MRNSGLGSVLAPSPFSTTLTRTVAAGSAFCDPVMIALRMVSRLPYTNRTGIVCLELILRDRQLLQMATYDCGQYLQFLRILVPLSPRTSLLIADFFPDLDEAEEELEYMRFTTLWSDE